MKPRGLCLILSSPSGGGKTTLLRELNRRFPKMRHSISYTTRSFRKSGRDIEEYHFISEAEFKNMLKKNEFLEWAVVHGNYYGTCLRDLEKLLDQGFDVILDIDIKGATTMRSKYPEGIQIFILPPSMDVLKQRLKSRASESEEDLYLRLRNAAEEMRSVDQYDYVVVNDDLELALKKIHSIMIAEHCRVNRFIMKNSVE